MNLTSNDKRIEAIDATIQLIESAYNKKCALQQEVQLMRGRFYRLSYKNEILKKFVGKQT